MKKLIEVYDEKKMFLREYTPVILFFALLFGFAIYESIKIGNYEEIFLSTAFDEKVLDVHEAKSYLFILMTNQPKRLEIRNSFNYDYKEVEESIAALLDEGDRIIKRKCSDTLYVIKNKKQYHFLIGDRLYNSKNHSEKFIQKYNKRRRIITTNNDCE